MSHTHTEKLIENETRIRVIEDVLIRTQQKIDALEEKLQTYFTWIMGLIFASIIVPEILHSIKLA